MLSVKILFHFARSFRGYEKKYKFTNQKTDKLTWPLNSKDEQLLKGITVDRRQTRPWPTK